MRCLKPSADYNDWLREIAAAKNAGLSCAEVEAWSSQGASYKAGEVEAKWDGLPGKIRLGTLIRLAKERGFSPSWSRDAAEGVWKPTEAEWQAFMAHTDAYFDAKDTPASSPSPAPKPATKPAAKEATWTLERLADYIERTAKDAGLTDYWTSTRGLTPETVARYRLGYDAQAKAVTIPDATGRSVKLRSTTKPDDKKERSYRQHRADGWSQDAPYLSDALEAAEPCICTEGEIDALTLRQLGINALALRGATQNGAAEYVAAHAKVAVIGLFDQDDTGRKGAEELSRRCQAHGVPYCCRLLEADPNAMLRSGKSAELAAIVAEAIEEASRQADEEAERLEREKAEYAAQFVGSRANAIRAAIAAEPRPVSTGITTLDNLLGGGVRRGRLYVLAAGSGLGKTTLALQLAYHLSSQGHDVLFVALEQSCEKLALKAVSRCTAEVADEPTDALTAWELEEADREDCRASLTDRQLATLELAWERHNAQAARLTVIDQQTSMDRLEALVERHERLTGRAPFIVVDYLQFLSPSADQQSLSHTDRARDNVRRLKALAVAHRAPTLALSSLNRQGYNVAVGLESLKDSGDIEFTADVVLGLQPAKLAAMDDGSGRAINAESRRQESRLVRVTCLKHREYKAGEALLEFDAKHSRFTDADITADLIQPMPLVQAKQAKPKPTRFSEQTVTDADLAAAFERLKAQGIEASQGNALSALLEVWEARQEAEGVASVRGDASGQRLTLTNLVSRGRLTVTQVKERKNAKLYSLPLEGESLASD
ncbi:MAG: DnaB-like helicase C-terminal domain-containing protein [Faecousia sp.]